MSIFIAGPDQQSFTTENTEFTEFFYSLVLLCLLLLVALFLRPSAARSVRAFPRAVAFVSACDRGLRFSNTPRRRGSRIVCFPRRPRKRRSAAAPRPRQIERLQSCQSRDLNRRPRIRLSR